MKIFARHALMAAALCMVAAGAWADEPAPRWRATIEVRQAAAFMALPLPASAYAKSLQPGLADLRLMDARGARVPFALLGPYEGQAPPAESTREVALYPLPISIPPPGATPEGGWASPVDIHIDGERISLSRRAGLPTTADARTPGWLFDLGDPKLRPADDSRLQALRLRWSGPAVFSAAYRFEVSDDLRQWRHGGGGQVMALAASASASPAPAGAGIEQPLLALGPTPPRFIRLTWADPATAPRLIAAQAVSRVLPAGAALTEIVFAASTRPEGAKYSAKFSAKDSADDTKHALHFDLGAVLPLRQIELRGPAGTWVVPVQVQARDAATDTWRTLGATVFYRLERGGETVLPPPWALVSAHRHLRLLPDARTAAPDAATVQLAVQASLATLVFAAQGQPPYTLLAGAKSTVSGADTGTNMGVNMRASTGALPAATLVPDLAAERLRFGQATLGPWREDAEATSSAESAARRAALRPWLLWTVLLCGVAALGFMVWRLARSGRPQGHPK